MIQKKWEPVLASLTFDSDNKELDGGRSCRHRAA
jgi:hypothetical protein